MSSNIILHQAIFQQRGGECGDSSHDIPAILFWVLSSLSFRDIWVKSFWLCHLLPQVMVSLKKNGGLTTTPAFRRHFPPPPKNFFYCISRQIRQFGINVIFLAVDNGGIPKLGVISDTTKKILPNSLN